MKKLTTAYENQDLHTLLSLEIMWMNRAASNEDESRTQKAEEQLKVYNDLLKDQVKSLQEELDHLFLHPRYFDIENILKGYHEPSFILQALNNEKQKLLEDFERFSSTIIDLKGGSNFKRIKQILKEFSAPLNFFEMIEFFL